MASYGLGLRVFGVDLRHDEFGVRITRVPRHHLQSLPLPSFGRLSWVGGARVRALNLKAWMPSVIALEFSKVVIDFASCQQGPTFGRCAFVALLKPLRSCSHAPQNRGSVVGKPGHRLP